MIRLIARSVIAFAAATILLTSCGKSSAPQAGSTASGEILAGSVSDAMLDTDRSQAQAPLAPAAHSAAGKSDIGASAAASDEAPTTDTAPADLPADQTKASPKAATTAKPPTP